ncbi:hypothetical protein DID80_04905 [Candidatus Marinamargulisbacteria bacterium SCGC AAA071-K20]|nr:hypothetical protein DID80_04905 [Candidatus Marinamargulisbacteria bacterium SCGC AAA071-K20]
MFNQPISCETFDYPSQGYVISLEDNWDIISTPNSENNILSALKDNIYITFLKVDYSRELKAMAEDNNLNLKQDFNTIYPSKKELQDLILALSNTNPMEILKAAKLSDPEEQGYICVIEETLNGSRNPIYRKAFLYLVPRESSLLLFFSGVASGDKSKLEEYFTENKDSLITILESLKFYPEKKMNYNSLFSTQDSLGLFALAAVSLIFLFLIARTKLSIIIIPTFILITTLVSAFGLYLVYIAFKNFSFHWTYLAISISLGAYNYLIFGISGRALERRNKIKISDFLTNNKESLEYDGKLTRLHSVLMIGFLPFFTFLLGVAFLAAITYVIYGFMLISILPLVPIVGYVALGVVAFVTAYGLLFSIFRLFFPKVNEQSGVLLSETDEKEIWGLVSGIAKKLNTKKIDQILIAATTGISVHQKGPSFLAFFGLGKRCLTLGVPTLYGLTVDEFEAILTHEYGHFDNKDTNWAIITHTVGQSLIQAFNSLPGKIDNEDKEESGGIILYNLIMFLNPAYWILLVFINLYFECTSSFSKIGEIKADIHAIKLKGPKNFYEGLLKVARNDIIFSEIIEPKIIPRLIDDKSVFTNFCSMVEIAENSFEKKDIESINNGILNDDTESKFSSHPSLKIRFSHARNYKEFDESKKQTTNRTLFTKKFSDWDELNIKVSDQFYDDLISKLKIMASKLEKVESEDSKEKK